MTYIPYQILTAAELNASVDGLTASVAANVASINGLTSAVAGIATSVSAETARALSAEAPLATLTALGTAADWGTAMLNWAGASSHMYVLSPDGRMAITGIADTLHGAATPFPVAIGISGFGFNNLSGGAPASTAWGGYFEARQYSGVTSNTFGVEIEVANISGVDSTTATPYSFVTSGTWGLFVASGAEVQSDIPAFTAKTATAAVVINNNGARFNSGIIFAHDALVGTDGAGTGTANAINLAAGHVIQWWQNSSTAGGYIYSPQTSGPSTGIRFEDNRMGVYSSAVLGVPVAAFANTPPAAGATTFELLVSNNAGVNIVGVTLGAPDSGGAGFRALIVPN